MHDVTVTLPEEDTSRLYAILLEVHDKAGNVGYARRLLLLDNSSSVQLSSADSLNVIHANPRPVLQPRFILIGSIALGRFPLQTKKNISKLDEYAETKRQVSPSISLL